MSDEQKAKTSEQFETMQDYLNTLYATERRLGLPFKWLLFLAGMFIVWGTGQAHTSILVLLSFMFYGMSNVLFSYTTYAGRKFVLPVSRVLFFLSYLADILFSSVLIYFTGAIGSELYLLYCLLALKGVIYYPVWHELLVPLYLSGPLYISVLYYNSRSVFFLTDRGFLFRYLLLFGVVLTATYLAWLIERKQKWIVQLSHTLQRTRQDLEGKTELIQQTAQDLGNRVMELRSLQEGVKAINSALALENVLRLIVANASQVLEGARCSIALLEKEEEVITMAASGVSPASLWGTRFKLGQGVAGWVVQNVKPALIGDVRQDQRFIRIGEEPICSLMSVPLISGKKAIGALSATSPRLNAFNTEDLSRLEAFADQAAVAVKNSRLYEGLAEEKKRTEELYRHVQEKSTELEAILRGIGDGVIVTDPNLKLLLMNPVAVRIFRLSRDVPSGAYVPELIANESLASLLRETLEKRDGAVIKEIEIPSSQDGRRSMIYQGLAAAISSTEGQVRGIVTVLRDITSQKELERMKSNFLSVVSHELKTPLHSIKGFVDIILMGKTGAVTEVQRDFLTTVKQQTGQLQNLINDLLEFSRLESGQVKLRLEQVALAEIAVRVVEKLAPLANEGQIALSTALPSDFPSVEGDAMRLEQVLTNLVDNAVKFTRAGGSVTIAGRDLGEQVQISVRDTGIGIPLEEQGRIFDRFYQVDSGSTRSYRGTGLGLTICKHIIEHHRGRIWFESKPGEGSTFYFVIPKKLPREEEISLDFTTLPSERRR